MVFHVLLTFLEHILVGKTGVQRHRWEMNTIYICIKLACMAIWHILPSLNGFVNSRA